MEAHELTVQIRVRNPLCNTLTCPKRRIHRRLAQYTRHRYRPGDLHHDPLTAPAAWMRRGLFRIMTIEQRLEQLEKSNKRLKDVLKIMAYSLGYVRCLFT